ncbi:MAG: O-antigen ligase family protein [Desulfobulbus sp.]|jgi:hypothetical protein
MPKYPVFFLLASTLGFALGLARGPVYGLMAYVFVYFNIPSNQWWGGYLPDLRWSFLSAGFLTFLMILHSGKLRKVSLSLSRPALYLVLLLLWMCIVVPFSYSPEDAWGRIYDFFRYVYIYILIIMILSDLTRYRLFLYSLIFNFFYLSYLAHSSFGGGRLDGVGLADANDANMFAALLLLIIPFLLQFLLNGSRRERIVSAVTFVMVVNAFMMCGSRGGFVGLFVEMLVFALLTINRKNFVKFTALMCAVLACLFVLIDPDYKARLLSLGEATQEGTATELSSGRADIWKSGIKMLHDYPMGTGGGGFMALSPYYLEEGLIEQSVGRRASHNTYLLILVEEGYVGMMIYLCFLLVSCKALLDIRREIKRKQENELSKEQIFIHAQAVALLSSLVGFMGSSFFIDRIYFECIYIFAALAEVIFFLHRQSVEHKPC